MWIYNQKTGEMNYSGPSGNVNILSLPFKGYSGRGVHKNDPDSQNIHNEGPIPCGRYKIGNPVDTETHGPFVMWLLPYLDNQMHGRSAFGIHGDSFTHPGEASDGCIILPHNDRVVISQSDDDILEVISGEVLNS